MAKGSMSKYTLVSIEKWADKSHADPYPYFYGIGSN